MYTTVAVGKDGFRATHRAWTRRSAMEWMAMYPAHVADVVYVKRKVLGMGRTRTRIVAARMNG